MQSKGRSSSQNGEQEVVIPACSFTPDTHACLASNSLEMNWAQDSLNIKDNNGSNANGRKECMGATVITQSNCQYICRAFRELPLAKTALWTYLQQMIPRQSVLRFRTVSPVAACAVPLSPVRGDGLVCRMGLLCLCCLLLLCTPLRAEELPDESYSPAQVGWQRLEEGLDSADIITGSGWPLFAVRISPQQFDFVLCASSEHGSPRSLAHWSSDFALVAAINAGMYLPDARTSVGYMRQGQHINQKRLANRPGAFFVAGPDRSARPDLPAAAILDRDDPRWQWLDSFALVVQNYRLIDASGNILWQRGGPTHAIAAVAEDRQGRILFLYAPGPLDPYEFSRELLDLPLGVRTAMYVEGGNQAGLLMRAAPDAAKPADGAYPAGMRVLGGQGRALLPALAEGAVLPNVLGVRRKAAAEGQADGLGRKTTENSP